MFCSTFGTSRGIRANGRAGELRLGDGDLMKAVVGLVEAPTECFASFVGDLAGEGAVGEFGACADRTRHFPISGTIDRVEAINTVQKSNGKIGSDASN